MFLRKHLVLRLIHDVCKCLLVRNFKKTKYIVLIKEIEGKKIINYKALLVHMDMH